MAGNAEPAAPQSTSGGGLRGRIGRLITDLKHLPGWTRRNPVRAAVTTAIALIVPTVVVVVGWSFLPTKVLIPVTLPEALKALDEGDHTEARRLAMAVYSNPALTYHEQGGPFYVLGAAIARDADRHWNTDEQRLLHLIAAKYLQEAAQHDFPPGREADGYFQLGKSWHIAGDPRKAVEAFTKALEWPENRAEIHRLLAESHLQMTPPAFQKALEHNARYLELEESHAAAIQEGKLREGRIYVALRDLLRARQALGQVDAAGPWATELSLVTGQLLIAEAEAVQLRNQSEEARQFLQQAVEKLRGTSSHDALGQGPPVAAQYLLGVCYERLANERAAEDQYSRIRRQYPDAPEGLAATLREVELLARRNLFDEAIELLRKLLMQRDIPSDSGNSVTGPLHLQQRTANLHQLLLDQGKYDAALELADSPTDAIRPWQLVLWKARTYEARATAAEQGAVHLPLAKAEQRRADARADRRHAGHEYARLAELRLTSADYTNDLWNSAQQFMAGQNYTRAVEILRTYLRNESRNRRPDALLTLAQAQLALNETEGALQSLTECLESFPKHPVTYRARIVAAQASAEKGLLDEAKTLLAENVENDVLSPRSAEWRDSLFLLARLNHREGAQREAKSRAAGVDDEDIDRVRTGLKELEQAHAAFRRSIELFGKAVQRYPEASESREAQYLLADAHRQASKWPRKRMKIVTIEATRAALARQSQQDLQVAVAEYDKLITQLGEVQDSPNHSDLEKRILRNGYFAKADALFDLGRYDDAIKAYSAATNRYQQDPESLEAYVQIAACYRLLDKHNEARGTLEQAKVMLARMKPDAPFTRATPYTRVEWEQLLNWLATL